MITGRALSSLAACVALFGATVVPASATGVAASTRGNAASATGIYQNCTALHTKYKHGVGRSNAHDHTSGKPVTTFTRSTSAYNTAMSHNKRLDADRDGIACEKA